MLETIIITAIVFAVFPGIAALPPGKFLFSATVTFFAGLGAIFWLIKLL